MPFSYGGLLSACHVWFRRAELFCNGSRTAVHICTASSRNLSVSPELHRVGKCRIRSAVRLSVSAVRHDEGSPRAFHEKHFSASDWAEAADPAPVPVWAPHPLTAKVTSLFARTFSPCMLCLSASPNASRPASIRFCRLPRRWNLSGFPNPRRWISCP